MLGREAEIAIIPPWPSSPDTQGRDEKGSTASRPEALTGVVTVAIRVVRPPRDKSRSVPVWPVGSSGVFGPGGDTTLRVQTKTLRSRGSDRDYPHPFQEEMMRMTQGWTGLRTAVIALGLFACASTGANADSISGVRHRRIDRCHHASRRGYRRECDQLCPDHQPLQSMRNSNISLGYFQVAAQAAGQSTTYTNTPFSITYVPGTVDGNAVQPARSRLPAS